MAEYEERYVAFVDILGFRNLVQKVAKGDLDAAGLKDLLQIVHERPNPSVRELKEGADFRAQSISDAVALSSALIPEGLDYLFYTVGQLATELLQSGIFIRGAITKGKLYHDERMVFGEGLVRAYDIESRIARFPRVVITRDVALDVARFKKVGPWSTHFRSTLKQADDGPMYLNFLAEIAVWVDGSLEHFSVKGTSGHPILELIEKMSKAIQQAFDESIDEPDIVEKMQWFSAYWNETIPKGIPGIEHIVGPGVTQKAFQ
jgi:hypothetical protein